MDEQNPNPKPLAATPPMGWNSWNMFGSKVSADAVCEIAEVMVKVGIERLRL